MRHEAIFCAVLVSAGACNDHRYGFFGDEEGATTGSPDPTDGRDPDPTGAPGTVTVTTQPDPGGPDTSEPPPSPSEPDPSGPSTITDPDPTGVPGVCGELELPPEVPLRFDGDNASAASSFALSCGLGSASEAVFVWTAPFDAVYRFDTAGSSFDTVLAVLGGFCGAQEFGCNDDALGVFSAVSTLVPAGQMVTIVVEGKHGEVGPLVLNIHEETAQECVFADIGSQLGEIAGSTTFGTSVMNGSCGGLAANEAAFVWTAPFSGLFRFETAESGFDPVLYAREGSCDGPELLCSDDFIGAEAGFDLFLAPEDGPIAVVVDGLVPGDAGPYKLRISAI